MLPCGSAIHPSGSVPCMDRHSLVVLWATEVPAYTNCTFEKVGKIYCKFTIDYSLIIKIQIGMLFIHFANVVVAYIDQTHGEEWVYAEDSLFKNYPLDEGLNQQTQEKSESSNDFPDIDAHM